MKMAENDAKRLLLEEKRLEIEEKRLEVEERRIATDEQIKKILIILLGKMK